MRVLKKYPNRRLYDTAESCFVTLADVRKLVLDHEEFRVEDSKSGKDLTSGVLLQIITEMEESGTETLLTNRVLEQLIRFYGSGMHSLLSQYLEQSLAVFLAQQDGLQRQMKQLMDTNPLNLMKQMSEQNLNFMRSFTTPPSGDKDNNR